MHASIKVWGRIMEVQLYLK